MLVVSSFVLALHLLAMNVFAAGPIVCIWLDWPANQGDPASRKAKTRLTWLACLLMLVGALLGLAVGWIRWDDNYRETLRQLSYRVHWGGVEFLFSGVLTLIYAVWLGKLPLTGTGQWLARSLLALVSATNLLYHFPPLFSLIGAASNGQIEISSEVNSRLFLQLIGQREVIPLSVHFALASLAVAGVATAILTPAARDSDASNPNDYRAIRIGGRIALAATVCQIPVGLWLVTRIPPREQRDLLGDDGLTATLLVASIMATFWLLHQLSALAFGTPAPRKIWLAGVSLAAVVVLMTFVLERGRAVRAEEERNQELRQATHASISPSSGRIKTKGTTSERLNTLTTIIFLQAIYD